MATNEIVGGSFRDPSGFVFRRDGVVYRQVNERYVPALEQLEDSGLYRTLVDAGLLVRHERADVAPPENGGDPASILRPTQIPFISYPYEWCFSQLKDAALTTLDIQAVALEYGMTLKDASAFNIQFLEGRPIFIDTLSFEVYEEGKPWVAYRQFCEHFLGPLLLMRRLDPWLGRLTTLTVDGIPLSIVSRLLPRITWLQPSSLLHIHLHARSIQRYGGRSVPRRLETRGLSRRGMENLVEGLQHTVRRLDWSPKGTEWAEYEEEHGYSGTAMDAKRDVVGDLLRALAPRVVWDLGANTGEFSRIALEAGAEVVSMDFDPAVVERNYRRMREGGESSLHPLWIDLRNPSSDMGWACRERDSLGARSSADVVLALALVHHLAIGANIPLDRMIEWFATLAPSIVIEFVPKEDPQVQRLLVSRQDIFDDYTKPCFEAALARHFELRATQELPGSKRVIYSGVRRG